MPSSPDSPAQLGGGRTEEGEQGASEMHSRRRPYASTSIGSLLVRGPDGRQFAPGAGNPNIRPKKRPTNLVRDAKGRYARKVRPSELRVYVPQPGELDARADALAWAQMAHDLAAIQAWQQGRRRGLSARAVEAALDRAVRLAARRVTAREQVAAAIWSPPREVPPEVLAALRRGLGVEELPEEPVPGELAEPESAEASDGEG